MIRLEVDYRKMFQVSESEELLKLQALVRSQDRTSTELRVELNAAKNKIKDLQAQMEVVRRKASANYSEISDQRGEVAALKAALADSQSRVTDLERSVSWQITSPLRVLGKTLARR